MSVALVTGGAKRIGAAISEGLAADGFSVAIHYRNSAEDAERLTRKITSRGGKAVALEADLQDLKSVEALIPEAEKSLGPVSVLVNNASSFEDDGIGSMTDASWALHMEANLRAPAFLAQAFANALPHGMQGNIINIIDQRVWRLTPKFLSYTVSKVGLWGLTQTLAQALAPAIRVNGIGPGPTLANERQQREDFERQCEALLLKQGAGLAEVQNAVRFILSTPSLTGQMLALDGGQHLAWQTPDVDGVPE